MERSTMKSELMWGAVIVATSIGFVPSMRADEKDRQVYPMALFPFEERGTGAKDYGAKVSDIVFATLAARPRLYLVERGELKKALEEQQVKTNKVIAIDRQSVVVVDVAEQVAGKSALQEAAAIIAERMLPKLVME
jgi:hypothetical protein